ncbi:methylglyoxal synthase [Prosthecochloris sp. N3]|uniref:Methylglyoxal synthase n=1 Tax=Prosthecochloris ethylica TaxID=2743976 RepID=A0ABR9XQD2_9CHLB|nr:methylglyoxal synthase [Prosthecochloris ethylica]MBF0587143.1 methylglyoxal synthase [Prosthecochloris ethylica]MBF0636011.1 methylglyoxal synthase [Prosthecochloris ethylica]NUK48359.1 methylglyoxal synthase [Prosthecochloris ethylica]
MNRIKRIGLVAHDNRKKDLIEWVEWNYLILIHHHLICTGTTGKLIEEAIQQKLHVDEAERFSVRKLKSGPLGGDQQLGALIAGGEIDFLIFLWDPMQPQPHDVDVKALLRIAVLYNIPTACNRSTADFMISSSLMNEVYQPVLKDYADYIDRHLDQVYTSTL